MHASRPRFSLLKRITFILVTALGAVGCVSSTVYTKPSGEPMDTCDAYEGEEFADCAARILGGKVSNVQGFGLGCRMRGEHLTIGLNYYNKPALQCAPFAEVNQKRKIAEEKQNMAAIGKSRLALNSDSNTELPCDRYDGDEKNACVARHTETPINYVINYDGQCRRANGRLDLQDTPRGYIKKCYKNRPERVADQSLPEGTEQSENYATVKSSSTISAGSIQSALSSAEWQRLSVAGIPFNDQGDRYLYLRSFRADQPYTSGRVISKATVRRADKLINMTLQSAEANECFAISDDENNFYAIRTNATEKDRFAFRNPINESKLAATQARQKTADLQSKLAEKNNTWQNITAQLAGNAAYKNGACVLLPTERVPPEPKKLPPRLVERNAHGACIYSHGGAFGIGQVKSALASAGNARAARDYTAWRDGDTLPLSCAEFPVDSYNKNTCRETNFLGMATREWDNNCINNWLRACFTKAKDRCNGTWNRWVESKQEILNRPTKLRQSCQQLVNQKANFDQTEMKQLKTQLKEAKLRQAQAIQSSGIYRRLSLTDSKTFCSIDNPA